MKIHHSQDSLRLKMKYLIILLLLTTCLFHSSQPVQVTDSGYTFTLEAVKILKTLMEADRSTDSPQSYSQSASLCADPKLPEEFTALCEKDDATTIFRNLVQIITSSDPCEICANAACTGCL